MLLNGEPLEGFNFDADTPEFVHLAIGRGAGVYRIEVTGLVPGTRTDWQETCISELQFTGRAPGAIAGSVEPTAAIGTLPDVYVAPPPDRASIEAAHVRDERWVVSTWRDLEAETNMQSLNAERGRTYASEECERLRDAALMRMATLVEPVDSARAAALRLEAAATLSWSDSGARDHALGRALDTVIGALEAVAVYLADDAARCRAARAASALRLLRIATIAEDAILSDVPDEFGPRLSAEARTRRDDALGHDAELLSAAAEAWSANPSRTAARLLAMPLPTASYPARLWPDLQSRLTTARGACGWTE